MAEVRAMPVFKGKRAPKRGNLVVNQGLSIIVSTRSPWYTKKREYKRLLPPWSMLRGYLVELAKRPALLAAAENFQRIAGATAGIERNQRRNVIRASLQGKTYAGRITAKRVPGRILSASEMEALIARLR